MTCKADNPAGRLHLILSRVGEVKPNTRYDQGWRQLLDVPNGNNFILLSRLASVVHLVRDAHDAVRGLGDKVNQDLHLRWVPFVEKAFGSSAFETRWDVFTNQLPEVALAYLEGASDQLSRLAPEPSVDQTELDELLTQIVELQRDVEASDIDPELQVFLLAHLRAAEDAIRNVRFTGSTGIRRVVAQTVGDAFLSPEVVQKSGETMVGGRFWKTISRLAIAVSFAANIAQIGEGLTLLLPESPDLNVVPTVAPEPPLPGADPLTADEAMKA